MWVCAWSATAPLTQVHVDSSRALEIRHVLVNCVQDLLLHLCDGVAVQHLDGDLWAVLVVRIHAVQDLRWRAKRPVSEVNRRAVHTTVTLVVGR